MYSSPSFPEFPLVVSIRSSLVNAGASVGDAAKARSLADLAVIAERLGLFHESDGNMPGGMELRRAKQSASSPAT